MPYDPRREVVWKQLAKYVEAQLGECDSVLELGAGYCHFINNFQCRSKYALDIASVTEQYANSDVTVVQGTCLKLCQLLDRQFDVIFASHLLEHLDRAQIESLLEQIHKSLSSSGKLVVLQPNYRYAYREYYDDYTHLTPLDHVSLSQLLQASGFRIALLEPRILPYSMGSTLPVFGWLVRLYLNSPWRPFAKQMFCIAEKMNT